MIESFRNRGLRKFYEKGDRSQVRADMADKIENILTILDGADTPQALDLPGLRLHPLKGDLKGCWSVTVRANWRIVFRFEDGNAYDVDLTDYH
jgi:proteic killer suppression protein